MVSLSLEQPLQAEAFTVPFLIRPFSVHEYELIGRHGILTEDDNVELLEGWIVPKITKTPMHEATLGQLQQCLTDRISRNHYVRNQCGITTNDSAPEPDLVIVRGTPRDYRERHPYANDISLVVEVADLSLAKDRKKRRVYAHAEISNYWIVNIPEKCVEVYSDPVSSEDPHYQSGLQFAPHETLEFHLADGTPISLPVSEFLY